MRINDTQTSESARLSKPVLNGLEDFNRHDGISNERMDRRRLEERHERKLDEGGRDHDDDHDDEDPSLFGVDGRVADDLHTNFVTGCVGPFKNYEPHESNFYRIPFGDVRVTFDGGTGEFFNITNGEFPSYDPDLEFTFAFDLTGLQSNCKECKIQISEGNSCSMPSIRFWDRSIEDGYNPWRPELGASYTSNQAGEAQGSFSLFNGFGFTETKARTVVVFAEDGITKIGCGELRRKDLGLCSGAVPSYGLTARPSTTMPVPVPTPTLPPYPDPQPTLPPYPLDPSSGVPTKLPATMDPSMPTSGAPTYGPTMSPAYTLSPSSSTPSPPSYSPAMPTAPPMVIPTTYTPSTMDPMPPYHMATPSKVPTKMNTGMPTVYYGVADGRPTPPPLSLTPPSPTVPTGKGGKKSSSDDHDDEPGHDDDHRDGHAADHKGYDMFQYYHTRSHAINPLPNDGKMRRRRRQL